MITDHVLEIMGNNDHLWECVKFLDGHIVNSMSGIPIQIKSATDNTIVVQEAYYDDDIQVEHVEIRRSEFDFMMGVLEAAVQLKLEYKTAYYLLREPELKKRIDALIAKNLWDALYAKELTMEEIASTFGVSKTAVSNALVGRASSLHAADFVVFQHVHGISPTDLLKDTEKAYDDRQWKIFSPDPDPILYDDQLIDSIKFIKELSRRETDDMSFSLSKIRDLLEALSAEGFRDLITVIWKYVRKRKRNADDLEDLLEFLMQKPKSKPSLEELHTISVYIFEIGKEKFMKSIDGDPQPNASSS